MNRKQPRKNFQMLLTLAADAQRVSPRRQRLLTSKKNSSNSMMTLTRPVGERVGPVSLRLNLREDEHDHYVPPDPDSLLLPSPKLASAGRKEHVQSLNIACANGRKTTFPALKRRRRLLKSSAQKNIFFVFRNTILLGNDIVRTAIPATTLVTIPPKGHLYTARDVRTLNTSLA